MVVFKIMAEKVLTTTSIFIPMKYLCCSIYLLLSITAQAQLVTDSLLIEGHYRTFSYQPPASRFKHGKLLLVMHGSGGSGKNMAENTIRLQAIAARENLLLVYPDGYQHFWNECRRYATSAANKENINEEAFFTALIQHCHQHFGIDTSKVFAAGFSGGGHMAYKLGLTMPHKIKAIAAIVANLPDSAYCDCAMAAKALPVLIVNGTADKVNPWQGGEMFVSNTSFGVVLSSHRSFGYWAGLAGYSGNPYTKNLPDTDVSDTCTITEFTYRQKRKPTVTLLQVNGGGHSFPKDVDVFLYLWKFCKQAANRGKK
jgi:polyhydroxybutyrate depolymerase